MTTDTGLRSAATGVVAGVLTVPVLEVLPAVLALVTAVPLSVFVVHRLTPEPSRRRPSS